MAEILSPAGDSSKTMGGQATGAVDVSRPKLRLYQPADKAKALGLAVNHLMTKPAFANLRFGDWSRILVGQINRNHFCFAVNQENMIVGFLGWALTTKPKAEAWVEGRSGLSNDDAM